MKFGTVLTTVTLIILLFIIPSVSGRKRVGHQQSLRAKATTTVTFGRDTSIRSELPEKLSIDSNGNSQIVSAKFQKKDGSESRTLSVSENRFVEGSSSFGFKVMGPNIIFVYPQNVGTAGGLTYYADRNDNDFDLDDAIAMVQNFVRRFEQQLFSSSRSLDGSRAFELRLGVKHYIKTVPIFGRPGKIFVGMNAGFDTGVSMLNMGDGFVTHPSFAAPPDFAPSNTGDFRAVISTGVMW